jgi:hypothetical protein
MLFNRLIDYLIINQAAGEKPAAIDTAPPYII